ncbi:MAG TPA: sulfurtransferase TusA family protein [Polyangia bacterium]|jgi:TusA-related sulfurtransferase
MPSQTLNCLGLKCPQPVLKLTVLSRQLTAGTMLEISADCAEFPADVKKWCTKQGKPLISLVEYAPGKFKAQIQF